MKNTHKIQVLLSETEFLMLKRMQFWSGLEGEPSAKSLSSFVRNILQNHIDDAPRELKQSVKNFKHDN